nr:hypothetical protein [uncultured Devosia sp.]
MHFQSIVTAAIVGILCANPASAKTKDVDALFQRSEPAQATMTLTEEGDSWRVRFLAGGLPNGAATAADCELEAVGSQDNDGVISASLVPFEGDINALSAADIGDDAIVIEVNVGPEGAFVTDAGASARHCGLGSSIDGFYQRADTGY